MKETQIFINKPIYLGLQKLEISKIVIYELWHAYVTPKYGEKAKLHYMDLDSFLFYIKAEAIYRDIAMEIETRFDNSHCELERPLPTGKKSLD